MGYACRYVLMRVCVQIMLLKVKLITALPSLVLVQSVEPTPATVFDIPSQQLQFPLCSGLGNIVEAPCRLSRALQLLLNETP